MKVVVKEMKKQCVCFVICFFVAFANSLCV